MLAESFVLWWHAILGLWSWMGIIATPFIVGAAAYRFMTRRTR